MHKRLTDMLFTALTKGCVLFGVMVLLWGAEPQSGWAQLERDRRGQQRMEQRDREARPRSATEKLPEWAAPSQEQRSARGQDGMRTKIGPPCPSGNCDGGDDPTR